MRVRIDRRLQVAVVQATQSARASASATVPIASWHRVVFTEIKVDVIGSDRTLRRRALAARRP